MDKVICHECHGEFEKHYKVGTLHDEKTGEVIGKHIVCFSCLDKMLDKLAKTIKKV